MNTVNINMSYRDYKNNFADCRNCGDYNVNGKCITVIIPSDRWEAHLSKSHNYGNKYHMRDYEFLILDPGYNEPQIRCFKAKSKENAIKQMRQYLKKNNSTLIQDMCQEG